MQENNFNEKEFVSGENTPDTAEHFDYNKVRYIPFGLTPETFEEKRGIRRAAGAFSVSLLFMVLFSFVWSLVYTIFMLVSGFNYDDPALMQVLNICLSSFLFTIPFIVIYKMFGFRISDVVQLKPPKKTDFLPLFLLGVSFCAFANIAVSYIDSIFGIFGIDYSVDFGEDPQGFFGFMLSVISTVVVPALVEEFAVRGLILGSLKKYGEGFAVVVSSIIFGLMHGNFEQIPFAFLVGLILGFITVKSKTIWIAVAVHGFNNLISVIFSYMDSVPNILQNIIYVCYLSLIMLIGIIAVCLLKKRPDFLKLEKAETVCSEKIKYKWVFTSPLTIIFIFISLIEAISLLF